MLKKMGPAKDLINSMPGMSQLMPAGQDPEQSIRRIQGIIDSMTRRERADPDEIDYDRRLRIARGSGTRAEEVKQLLTQFEMMRNVMRAMAKMSMLERIKMMSGMSKMGAFMPGAMSMNGLFSTVRVTLLLTGMRHNYSTKLHGCCIMRPIALL